MEKKPCPVDRGKLLIGLECCREQECRRCPYDGGTIEDCDNLIFDALAYIYYLEELLNAKADGSD